VPAIKKHHRENPVFAYRARRMTEWLLPLVLAAQLVRLFIVTIAGPPMAKIVAGWQRPES
jgi:hypothetical protein